ncbi:MAG TPA: hypothetical protein VGK67_13400 [Myxococcales bacterium]
MRETDFAQVVEEMVAEELSLRLEPFKKLLQRLDEARSVVQPRKGPGRPPRAEIEKLEAILTGGRIARGAKRAPAAAARPARASRSLKPGDVVKYRQGRGTFDAFVIRSEPGGDVVVERISDGKRVKRPAAKLV